MLAAGTALVAPACATETTTFDPTSFGAAQKAGKPILVAIHASWCPTCKAQRPILSELMAEPKFKDLVYFVVDFDTQKDAGRPNAVDADRVQGHDGNRPLRW
jgi:thiol-disulfide isomerase/thioredoxin